MRGQVGSVERWWKTLVPSQRRCCYICLLLVTRDFQHVQPEGEVCSLHSQTAVLGGVWLRLVERLMVTKLRLNHSINSFFSTVLAVVLCLLERWVVRERFIRHWFTGLNQAWGASRFFSWEKSWQHRCFDFKHGFYSLFVSVLWHSLRLGVRSAPHTAGSSFLLRAPWKAAMPHPGGESPFFLLVSPKFLQFQVPWVRGVRQVFHSLGLALRGAKIILSCSRRGLGWTFGRISSHKEWLDTGTGCPGTW